MRCRVRHHDHDSVTAAGAYGTGHDGAVIGVRTGTSRPGRGDRPRSSSVGIATSGGHLMRVDRERAMPLPGGA